MPLTYPIDRYSVLMPSTRPTTELNPNIAVAGIFLYEGSGYRGYAYFFPDGTALSPPVIDAPNNFIALHYNLSQLGPVLQMIREEQPIYLFEFGATFAGLSSGFEPTGEEEGLRRLGKWPASSVGSDSRGPGMRRVGAPSLGLRPYAR